MPFAKPGSDGSSISDRRPRHPSGRVEADLPPGRPARVVRCHRRSERNERYVRSKPGSRIQTDGADAELYRSRPQDARGSAEERSRIPSSWREAYEEVSQQGENQM